MESLKGRLLVAAPALQDPNFSRTVTLMLEHNEEGALGVVLNRPGGLKVDEPLPQWDAVAAPPAMVFVGGPVAASSAIGVARAIPDYDTEGFQPLFLDLGTVDLELSPADLPGIELLRVFGGYASWVAGQLEGELALGGWFVIDAVADDAFSPHPEGLWREVLLRQRGPLKRVANFPPDPRLN